MDTRKLDTGQVLAHGIIDKPTPTTEVPEDQKRFPVDIDNLDETTIAQALERDEVVEIAEYYGIPIVWKAENGYRATLLQYRSVTEDHTFATAAQAAEWFVETAYAVAG